VYTTATIRKSPAASTDLVDLRVPDRRDFDRVSHAESAFRPHPKGMAMAGQSSLMNESGYQDRELVCRSSHIYAFAQHPHIGIVRALRT
jgi:hypothetical protein